MTPMTEVELKFQVAAASRKKVLAEVNRATAVRTSLHAIYLDTPDRRLARQGLSWRLRREGRRWVQTLKAAGAGPIERFEHEVVRPAGSHDALLHAGSPPGDRLIAVLRVAHAEGFEPVARFTTQVRRISRRVCTRGAIVEVAFDEGRVTTGQASQPLREIEFELVSGSVAAMLELAERWRKRFGLVYDPRSKAERGDCLASGSPSAPLRKAQRTGYPHDATPAQASGAVVDECLAHITRNAVGIVDGDPAVRVEQVHQVRVGIRRLRSALRCFEEWVTPPPDELVDGLRTLFATLGQSRDSDLLGSGVSTALANVAGAPSIALAAGAAGPDPVAAVSGDDAQRTFLAALTWRIACTDLESADAKTFHRKVQRRLRRWHARIVADADAFDELDDTGLHALRKRIKRQRYAVEFFLPLLAGRKAERYLKPLAATQDRMGELSDLWVARDRYQAAVAADPAAWFALGWLAARIDEARARAKVELARLAAVRPPRT